MMLDAFLGEARHITACILLGIGIAYFIVLAVVGLAVLLPLALLARIFDPQIARIDTTEEVQENGD